MANPERGEVALEVNGETYTLKPSMNALATLQKRHGGKTFGAMLKAADELDVEAIRGVVWAFLQKHHAERFKTEEQVGNFIDDAGGVSVFMQTIGEALALNADPNRDAPAMTRGTGESSMSALVGSA